MNTQVIEFNNSQLKVIESNNQRCLTSTDIAKALGFEKVKSISNIYTRHADEFEGLSWVINLMTETQSYHNRVFNREGAWLIGMFARTPKAAEFRKWVLKVLGTVADYQLPTAQIDMRAIGGLVKKCCAVAVREELNAILASDQQADWEVSDKDLLFQLYRWHNTKNKAETAEFRRLHAENDALLAENTQLKERNKKAVKLLEEK